MLDLNLTLDRLVDEKKIHIGNKSEVLSKFSEIKKGGTACFQVISDFDYTISKFRDKGKTHKTSHGIFEETDKIPYDLSNELVGYKNYYLPIEMDPSIPIENKKEILPQWWKKAHAAILNSKPTCEFIKTLSIEGDILIRDYFAEFCKCLDNQSVPLLIFSAGLGDAIVNILDNLNICQKNIDVLSNFFRFDQSGTAVSFYEPGINCFNKSLNVLANHVDDEIKRAKSSAENVDKKEISKTGFVDKAPISHVRADRHLGRPHVLLLGDSKADEHMADGLERLCDSVIQRNTISDKDKTSEESALAGDCAIAPLVLKIGFLNSNVADRLPYYEKMFDIVLLEQDSFELPYTFVKWILDMSN